MLGTHFNLNGQHSVILLRLSHILKANKWRGCQLTLSSSIPNEFSTTSTVPLLCTIIRFTKERSTKDVKKKDAITIGDTTATIFFYQNKDFVTGPHMIVVRADWFNIYTAHFLIAVLNFLRFNITSPACHSTVIVLLSWQQYVLLH